MKPLLHKKQISDEALVAILVTIVAVLLIIYAFSIYKIVWDLWNADSFQKVLETVKPKHAMIGVAAYWQRKRIIRLKKQILGTR